MKDTRPIFVLSSGRSGTQMLDKVLSAYLAVESHHEHLLTHLKPAIIKFQAGLLSSDGLTRVVDALHGRSIMYSERAMWADSSYALSWVTDSLLRLFPSALFVHLVRDGRKVVSSFFHKLADEVYSDHGVQVLEAWLRDPEHVFEPPPEKQYWWHVPMNDSRAREEFASFTQFERICYHWREVNAAALAGLQKVPPEQQKFIRLEDLVSNRDALDELMDFLGLPVREEVRALLARPHNVNRPEDFPLTPKQSASFERIAGAMQERLGYAGREEYRVRY